MKGDFASMAKNPKYDNVPLVCDMSSNFLSRPVENIDRYGLIFAGAQKNLGPAGVTVVIVRKDLLQLPKCKEMPLTLDYALQAKNQSMYNTPPTWSIYVSSLVLDWIERDMGGLEGVAKLNGEKARRFYAAVEASNGFYACPVAKDAQSRMNIVFRVNGRDAKPNVDLEKAFLADAELAGFIQLAGHRSVGGLRASLYNAMPLEGVDALVSFMADFARKH
jgi:phosphoserine aminotransferase